MNRLDNIDVAGCLARLSQTEDIQEHMKQAQVERVRDYARIQPRTQPEHCEHMSSRVTLVHMW